MTSQAAAPKLEKIVSNNETFTIGSYVGFEILIRDKDNYINATKLVQLINEQENTRKLLKNITSTHLYRQYKQYINEKRAGLETIQPPQLEYQLINEYINEVRGTYIHKKLINIICMKTSIKYLDIVTEIMDKINERVIAEHNADPNTPIGTHVDNVTSEFMNYQQEKIDELREENIELKTDVKSLIPRAVPKGKQRSFCLIVEEVHQYDDQIKIQIKRKMKKTISKGLMEYYKNDTLLFIDNLPIATTINEVIKEQLSTRVGMKIKATKYTFPYDQLDDIIERIKEIVIEVQDV
ncbi:MAG: hypothetical protein EZS28_039925 [Streblomastix strix]|uniref:KilA-N domain-containing protein n=1 Tax=Streblomastix strix TaxID=222440 RepID=A0A5J4U2H2_9EUKA|nr:MAG: hypothetical protein EZS28_039925 [Streblomastix strix]